MTTTTYPIEIRDSLTSPSAPSPTVTVLMTCYNTEQYLAQAVESILAQSLTDFEFIVVNDGSTDGSLNILQNYAARDKRLRIMTGANVGIVASAIKGTAAARGEFIARLDSDDVALPTRLEKQVAYFRQHPECVALGSRVLVVDPDEEVLCEWGTLVSHEEIDRTHMNAGAPAIIHPAAMFRRAALLAVGGYNPAHDVLEDLDLFLRLAEYGRLTNLPEPLTKWRQHSRSCCHTRTRELRLKTPQVIAEANRRRGIECPPRTAESAPRPLSEADHHLRWAWWALMDRRIPVARKHAFAALRRKPFSSDIWRAVACAVRGH